MKLSNQNELPKVLDLFGGEEKCKNDFPAMYRAYKTTLMSNEKARKTLKNVSGEEAVDDTTESCSNANISLNVISVGRLRNKKDTIRVYVEFIVQESVQYKTLTLIAKKISTPSEEIARKIIAKFEGTIIIGFIDVPDVYYNDCVICAEGTIVGNQAQVSAANAEQQLKNATTSVQLNSYNIDIIPAYTVTHPNTAKSNTRIKIGYGIASGDYKNSSAERDAENVYFPSDGDIYIGNNYFEDSNIDATLFLQNPANNVYVEYDTPKSKMTVENLNKIKWSIPKTWGTAKTLKKLIPYNSVDGIIYYLSITAKLRNGQMILFTITNDPNAIFNDTPDLKLLYFNLDCFAPGTKIKMADGFVRDIENIRPGEKVDGGDGKISTVRNIIKSTTPEDMMTIVTEDGHSLILSLGHPLLSDKGFISANSAVEGVLLKTENNTFTRVKTGCAETELISPVYNLELEDGNRTVIANGLIAGDCVTEVTVKEKESDVRSRIAPELLKDYDSFAKLGQL